MSDQSLKDFIVNNAKYLKLEDGEIFQGEYKGHRVIPNRFDTDKNTVQYKLRYTDRDKEIYWENGSSKVATAMMGFKIGEAIQIKRVGVDKKTSYEITSLSKGGMDQVAKTERKKPITTEPEPDDEVPF